MTDSAPSAFADARVAAIRLGRAGVPADLAPLVVFLIGPESRFISGAEIPVDVVWPPTEA
ncbi:hypothetical protein [Rhodococcus sp. NCIMB 12038]|uniref:hypothetical protein n=1 Tax=Rhodococcus sp. NCIMB 12038 TaxID=933800 RepID=UPI000B3C81F8|nr:MULTISPECIES: hypothetical protein [unclassified Rhodococcus (in: high G+C Gram-positive bacteria)]OUS92851.1 hypothetical protein CA951_26310 [Rhodococcus sp. NCIMB 12038]OZE92861.1 hypothetical protein CH301_28005 [Rhodococcus sp. 15-1189-1-1a]OZF08117.1 hypothetical protein CH299_28525 [Rhodococcus sp. 14-2686-1-2]